MAALSARLGHPLTGTQLKEAMDDMDADGSGEVDLQEFQDWFSRGKEVDAAVTELNLSSVLLILHQPKEALEAAHNAVNRLMACSSAGEDGASSSKKKKKKKRTKRSPGVDVGRLRATNATFGSVVTIACLVQGKAEQKVAADYETFSMAARSLKHGATHAERWWDYSSPLAKGVIEVASRLENRLVRHLPETTPEGKLRSLPIPVAALQALERSRASTPGPSFADRRAAARRAYSRSGPRPKSVAGRASLSRSGTAGGSMSRSANYYTGSSLQHASFRSGSTDGDKRQQQRDEEDDDDEEDDTMVDFLKPRCGKRISFAPFCAKNDRHFTKTRSEQT